MKEGSKDMRENDFRKWKSEKGMKNEFGWRKTLKNKVWSGGNSEEWGGGKRVKNEEVERKRKWEVKEGVKGEM